MSEEPKDSSFYFEQIARNISLFLVDKDKTIPVFSISPITATLDLIEEKHWVTYVCEKFESIKVDIESYLKHALNVKKVAVEVKKEELLRMNFLYITIIEQ
jgi:hypothetical protein